MPDQTRRVRISIADDHQIFRDGLKRLLESEPGFEVVSEGADGLDAIRMARDSQPDILLLDVAMPRMVVSKRWPRSPTPGPVSSC
jgi:two-component system response regulator DegU